jgi:hypothetical protein
MTQPNFLQVQNSLTRACAFVVAHPDLESSNLYAEHLEEMCTAFEDRTEANDRLYTTWRERLGEQGVAARDAKRAYDRVLELADEHAYDDAPVRPIVYTDEEQLFPLVRETISWLGTKNDEWEWLSASQAELEQSLEETTRRGTIAEDARVVFTVDVKRRIAVYDASVALLREYLKDAKREGSRYASFSAVTLDIL